MTELDRQLDLLEQARALLETNGQHMTKEIYEEALVRIPKPSNYYFNLGQSGPVLIARTVADRTGNQL